MVCFEIKIEFAVCRYRLLRNNNRQTYAVRRYGLLRNKNRQTYAVRRYRLLRNIQKKLLNTTVTSHIMC